MKIVILIALVIANSIECEAEKSVKYDQYKLVRMFTSGIKDQKTVYDFLTPKVDFWTSPYTNGTVDFMISPIEFYKVTGYLRHQRISYKSCSDVVNEEIVDHPTGCGCKVLWWSEDYWFLLCLSASRVLCYWFAFAVGTATHKNKSKL